MRAVFRDESARALNSLRDFLCAEPPTASSHRMGLCSWPSALEAGSPDICAMLRAADTGDLDAILMATKSVMLLAS